MDAEIFFSKTKKFLINLLVKVANTAAVRVQSTTWIRFTKAGIEVVDLAFNSRMLNVYNLSDIDEIATQLITQMSQQIENPALANSRLVFDKVICMDVDLHRLNLTRGCSYLPLPDWLACKVAIINPNNSDLECFKWAVIAAM